MSSKFDDIIKNKLAGLRAEYDPSDWAAMEQMLDNPGNKVLGGWIWNLSAIGFILLGALSVAGVLYNNNSTVTSTNSPIEIPSSTEKVQFETHASFECLKPVHCDFELTTSPVNSDNSDYLLSNEVNKKMTTKTGASIAGFNQTGSSSSAVPPARNERSKSTVNTFGDDDMNNILALAEKSDIDFAMRRRGVRPTINMIQPYAAIDRSIGSEETVLRFQSPQQELENQSKWNYFYGLSSSLSLSYLDDNLMPRPGYGIGLVVGALFSDRVSIYSGLKYSQIEYETSIFDCDPTTRYRCPVYYTSLIKSVDIPVGISYNVVRKNSWRFSVNGGITNHIKLEEKFSYIFEPDNSEPLPPRSNPFTSNNSTSSLERSFSRDFTLSEEKRYHVSYHLGFGLEKFIARQMSIGIGPEAFMTATTAGNKDARIVTFGMNGSLKIYPGR